MRSLSAILAIAILATCVSSTGETREAAKPGLRITRESSEAEPYDIVDPGLRGLYEEAAVDTYCLVWYDFEQIELAGLDARRQNGAAGALSSTLTISPDSAAALTAASCPSRERNRCGAEPVRTKTTSISARGTMLPVTATAGIRCSRRTRSASPARSLCPIKIVYDSEPDYDYTRVEYDAGKGRLADGRRVHRYRRYDCLATLSRSRRRGRSFASTSPPTARGATRTVSTTPTAAASSTASASSDFAALNNYENFESRGGRRDERRHLDRSGGEPAFGTILGLKNNLTDKDPCGDNFAHSDRVLHRFPESELELSGSLRHAVLHGPGRHRRPVPERASSFRP